MRLIDADCLNIHDISPVYGFEVMGVTEEEINLATTVNQWIPTSERLPDKDGKYLCTWQGMSVGTGMFINGHFRLYGEIKDNLVTAWMPLPEPYKGVTT